jgi:hypothetical protein
LGAFPLLKIDDGSEETSLEELCRRIEEETGTDRVLIQKTIRSFVRSGYIKAEIAGEMLSWHWTHNNRVDRLPGVNGSSADGVPSIP